MIDAMLISVSLWSRAALRTIFPQEPAMHPLISGLFTPSLLTTGLLASLTLTACGADPAPQWRCDKRKSRESSVFPGI